MDSSFGRHSSSPPRNTSEEDALDEPPPKRRRATNGSTTSAIPTRRKTACQSCRLRKVKCDNSRPSCAICKANGSNCEYLDNGTEKLTLEAATGSLIARLDKLQEGVDNLHRRTPEQSIQPFYQDNDGHTTSPDFRLLEASPTSHRDYRETIIIEPSRDYLQIPPHKTTADTVLNWEIFENRYPRNALICVLFVAREQGFPGKHNVDSLSPSEDTFAVPGGLRPPEEERIPTLIDNFLQNVHTKNPILDVESLVKQGRKCSEQGLGWDAWSCLVLLACALGAVAKPFDTAAPLPPVISPESLALAAAPPPKSAAIFAKELQQGESCFVLACRRLGSLKHTMLGAQCHFFAGVYLMYTLRPLLSWQYFYHASILYQLYLKTTHGILGNNSEPFEIPVQHLNALSRKQRRLEQSLYWSCFKSECEFRVELPLPQSEIASCDYPNMFPSPPSPAGAEPDVDQTSPGIGTGNDPILNHLTRFDTSSTLNEEDLELRQHAKRLCNEEESWYYYLTEIALRRIGNRIINTFFRQDHTSWLNVKPLLRIALEFDVQVSSWSAHLPPAMQHYETTSTIRAPPTFNSLTEGVGNYVSRELSWATDNRLLEMRSWLYQPFMYYLVHSGSMLAPPPQTTTPNGTHSSSNINSLLNPSVPHRNNSTGSTSTSLDAEDTAILRHMVQSGIECNLKLLDVRSLRHRHHGLWYDLRSTMCAALILLAVVKSGHEGWIPGGVEVLWGNRQEDGESVIAGRIGKVLAQFDFWAVESPDLIRLGEVLGEVVRDVRGRRRGRV